MEPLTDDQIWGCEQDAGSKLCPLSDQVCGFWKVDSSGNGECTFDDYCFFKYHDLATEDTEKLNTNN